MLLAPRGARPPLEAPREEAGPQEEDPVFQEKGGFRAGNVIASKESFFP